MVTNVYIEVKIFFLTLTIKLIWIYRNESKKLTWHDLSLSYELIQYLFNYETQFNPLGKVDESQNKKRNKSRAQIVWNENEKKKSIKCIYFFAKDSLNVLAAALDAFRTAFTNLGPSLARVLVNSLTFFCCSEASFVNACLNWSISILLESATSSKSFRALSSVTLTPSTIFAKINIVTIVFTIY